MTTKIIIKIKEGEPRINKEGLTKLYVQYQHNSKTTLFPILQANPKYLRLINNEPIDPYLKQHKGSASKIKKIKSVRLDIESIANELEERNIDPTIELVKKKYVDDRNKNTESESTQLYNYEKLHLKFEQLYLNKLKPSSKRSHINSRNAVIRFLDFQKLSGDVSEMNLDFYDLLVNYLMTEEDKMDNTIGKIIKDLKVLLNWAKDRGYKISSDVNHKSFKAIRKSSDIIFLTEDEFQKLYDQIFDQKHLERVRDVFIFNCRIGLRYGDLIKLRKSDFDNGSVTIKQQKTGKKTLIPLTSIPLEILKKYDFELPFISEQKMNKYLKDACEKAEIIAPVEYRGQTVPKYKVMTTHCAIKTFITHSAGRQVQPKVVSEITGKSLSVIIDHYYGIDKESITKEMERAFA